jgi:hypothetical protein
MNRRGVICPSAPNTTDSRTGGLGPVFILLDSTSHLARVASWDGLASTNVNIFQPVSPETSEPAELAATALALVREQAPETQLPQIAARPIANHPEYQQVNRIGRRRCRARAPMDVPGQHHHRNSPTHRGGAP